MKRFISGLLAGLILATAVPAFAGMYGQFKGYDIVRVVVNDQQIQSDVPAIMVDGRTMVPLRFVSETLGAEVKWDDATWTASINGVVSPIPQKEHAEEKAKEILERFMQRTKLINEGTLPTDLEMLSKLQAESLEDSLTTVNYFYIASVAGTNPSLRDDWETLGPYFGILNQATASEVGFWATLYTAVKSKNTQMLNKAKQLGIPLSYFYGLLDTYNPF